MTDGAFELGTDQTVKVVVVYRDLKGKPVGWVVKKDGVSYKVEPINESI